MSCLYHLRKTEVYKQQFTVVGGGGGVGEGGGGGCLEALISSSLVA